MCLIVKNNILGYTAVMQNSSPTSVKSVLILGRYEVRDFLDSPHSMVRELTKTNTALAYSSATLEELVFNYDGSQLRILDGSGGDIARFDGIFMLGWFKNKMIEDIALSVALYAAAHNIPYLNPEVGLTRSNSKLSQSVGAVLNGVSVTPFVFSSDHQKLAAQANSLLSYPFILKSVRAARGNDNYLVRSDEQFQAVLKENPDISFIAQAFVPNDGDYRIVVMGGEIKFVIHRLTQSDSHLNNTSQGGAATEVNPQDLPAAMREESIKISKALRRDVTGVDMIVDKRTGQHYFLEINNMPQLSTGSLVPQKMQALDAYLTQWLNV